jgi:Kdo2-lipid IVA lauroyltransferase/acyltransferase
LARIKPRITRYRNFLAPKYWPTWLGLFIARLIAHLPLRVQCWLGSGLGTFAYTLFPKRVEVTRRNIKHCMPELDDAAVEKLIKASFQANGIGIIEGFRCWFNDREKLRNKTFLHGLEHLFAARDQGKGVILLGGHFCTLESAGCLATMFFESDVVQRDMNNALFNAVMSRSRDALYGAVLSKRDLKGVVRRLKQGKVVWFATDQDNGRRASIFVPFFGQKCATLVSPMRLAKISGAPVVIFSHFRRPNAEGYDIYFQPALENFPTGDDVADATLLNQILEQEIRRHPEQYLWMHRRFKTPEQPNTVNLYGQLKAD